MKPRSKSVWILPAAWGALVPAGDGPGAALVLGPAGQVGDQAQQGDSWPGSAGPGRTAPDPGPPGTASLSSGSMLGDVRPPCLAQMGMTWASSSSAAVTHLLHRSGVARPWSAEAVLVHVGGEDHGLQGQQVGGGETFRSLPHRRRSCGRTCPSFSQASRPLNTLGSVQKLLVALARPWCPCRSGARPSPCRP